MKHTYTILGCLILNMSLAAMVIAHEPVVTGAIHDDSIQQASRNNNDPDTFITAAAEQKITKKRFRVVKCYGLVPVNKYFDTMGPQCKKQSAKRTGDENDREKALFSVSH